MFLLFLAMAITSAAGHFQAANTGIVPQASVNGTAAQQSAEPAHSDNFLDSLFVNPTYRKWVTFWAARIRAIDPRDFKLTLTDSASMPPVLPRGETVRAELRRDSASGLPLIYSPNRKFFVVLHYRGRTDPSFNIVGLQDSTFTYVTFGPASFFDAAVWLSNSELAVLGFTFYPSAVPSKGYINATILDYNFSRRMQRVYSSSDLSWEKYGRFMNQRAFENSRH